MSWHEALSMSRAAIGILGKGRPFGGPIQAELSLTNRCNFTCIHCYYHSSYLDRPSFRPVRRARQTNGELPEKNGLKQMQRLDADPECTNALLDDLMARGTRRFQFSGNGEPFMHAHAIDFMARVKHAGCRCWTMTAGHLLNHDKIDELLAIGLDELRITVMAGNAEGYERTHPGCGPSTFANLRDNLLYMAERKHALRLKRPVLNLFCVVISQNHDELVNFARFAVDVRADGTRYRPFDDVGDPGLVELIPSQEQAVVVQSQLEEARQVLDAAGLQHNVDSFLKAFGRRLDTAALYRVIPCYYPWLAIRVGVDGNLYPCCRGFVPMGNAHQQPFAEIWNGSNYRQVRKEALTINRRNIPVTGCTCHSCVNFSANLRVHRYFHPLKSRGRRLRDVLPAQSSDC